MAAAATPLVVSEAEAEAMSSQAHDKDALISLKNNTEKIDRTIAREFYKSVILSLAIVPVIVTIQYAITKSFDLLYETQTLSMQVLYSWVFAVGLTILGILIYTGCATENERIKRKRQFVMRKNKKRVTG